MMNTSTEKAQSAVPLKSEDGVAAAQNLIKSVVAVMSGKGGVGKSFVTSLLASALAREGYAVGILDADITGPSIPMLFGLHGPVEPGTVGIQPPKSHTGIKVISMNLLLSSEDQPVIWRGPLISKAIKQLWGDVEWGTLDYLLVDLPPGTSDATLTIMQSLPVKGIVMVTTPQGLAGLIVRKTVRMAQSIGVPIAGVVENMAYFVCPECSKRNFIFGESHAEEVAATAGAPLLARLPIDPQIAALCDAGKIEEVNIAGIPEFLQTFFKAMQAIPEKKND
jgi:Mrp family chromosome partitioning ATPase